MAGFWVVLRHKDSSAAGGEKGLEKCRGLFGEDAGNNVNAMIEARVREDFEARAYRTAARIIGTVD